jgi:hypothetical protein
MRLFLSVLLLSTLASCALPPGYEEELYCPGHMCLKRKQQPPGWTGPRSMFHECCDDTHGQTARPHAWGVLVDENVKQDLIRKGWHLDMCAEQNGVCGRVRRLGEALVSRADALVGVLLNS